LAALVPTSTADDISLPGKPATPVAASPAGISPNAASKNPPAAGDAAAAAAGFASFVISSAMSLPSASIFSNTSAMSPATLVRVWIINVIDIIVNFVGAFFIIAHFDTPLAILMVGYMLIYYLIAHALRRQTVLASKKKNVKEEEVSGLMYEVMNNIRSVKVLGMAAPLLDYVQKLNDQLMKLLVKNMFWYHLGILARSSWQGIARVCLLLFVIYGIFEGKYELGFLILFHGYFSTLSSSVDDLSTVAQDVALAKTDIGRLAEFFDEKVTIDVEEGKTSFPSQWDAIHIRNLSFAYGNNHVLRI
jgi:ABC-type bacteriocin/lantibiotic exporter with double-glycine peptidase domain